MGVEVSRQPDGVLNVVTKTYKIRGGLPNGNTNLGDLPAGTVILGQVLVNVLTAEATGATKNIDVGHNGDRDGLAVDADVSSEGWIQAGRGALISADSYTELLTQARTLSVSAPNAMTELDADIHVLVARPASED